MAKYTKRTQCKIRRVLHKMKKGTLKKSTGKNVKKLQQAIAIGISEAKQSGEKVPV